MDRTTIKHDVFGIINVRDWEIRGRYGPYVAPEAKVTFLDGRVTLIDGSERRIATSAIMHVDIEARVLTTKSGTRYRLVGEASDNFAFILTNQGFSPSMFQRGVTQLSAEQALHLVANKEVCNAK